VNENGGAMPNGVWKWVAAVLVAVILAGAPGMVQAIKAPSQEEVNIIRERQNIVLQRLAAIDIVDAQNRELLEENQALLLQIQQELREHEDNRR